MTGTIARSDIRKPTRSPMTPVTDTAVQSRHYPAMTTDYKDLATWQSAMRLVKEIYSCTRSFPRDELFGLSSQMRRAAVYVPSNIAEGKGRYSQKELLQFLYKSRGSLMELETQILIATDLGYLDEPSRQTLIATLVKVTQLLNGLIRRFQAEVQTASLVSKPRPTSEDQRPNPVTGDR